MITKKGRSKVCFAESWCAYLPSESVLRFLHKSHEDANGGQA